MDWKIIQDYFRNTADVFNEAATQDESRRVALAQVCEIAAAGMLQMANCLRLQESIAQENLNATESIIEDATSDGVLGGLRLIVNNQ